MAKDKIQNRYDWADVFAAQSRSDFQVYDTLPLAVEDCHRLHYLQMAGEKIAKAYRLRDTEIGLEEAMKSHVAFSHFAASMLISPSSKTRYKGKEAWLQQTLKRVQGLAREIEKLAPAVDRQRSPANAEYPWAEEESIVTPCRYVYPVMTALRQPSGSEFLKLLRETIEDYPSTQPA